MTNKIFFDYETRSTVDLKDCGVYVYSHDDTTEPLCLAWAVNDEPVQIWRPLEGDSMPEELLTHVVEGAEMIAHNAQFERLIWNNCCVKKYGWPPLRVEQLTCTMIMSYSMGLMGSLEDAAHCVGLRIEKDMKGHRVMLQLAKPRVIYEDGTFSWWHREDSLPNLNIHEKYDSLYSYCMTDVNVHRELYKRLLPISDEEKRVWCLDQLINDRGVYVDTKSALAAVELADLETELLKKRMQKLTGGFVGSCNAHSKLKQWINEEGVFTESVDKAAIHDLLEDDSVPGHVREVLEVRQLAAKSSTAKIIRMIDSNYNGRCRGNFQYHGAASTGRWAGRGIQLQNMPRPSVKHAVIEEILDVLSKVEL